MPLTGTASRLLFQRQVYRNQRSSVDWENQVDILSWKLKKTLDIDLEGAKVTSNDATLEICLAGLR